MQDGYWLLHKDLGHDSDQRDWLLAATKFANIGVYQIGSKQRNVIAVVIMQTRNRTHKLIFFAQNLGQRFFGLFQIFTHVPPNQ